MSNRTYQMAHLYTRVTPLCEIINNVYWLFHVRESHSCVTDTGITWLWELSHGNQTFYHFPHNLRHVIGHTQCSRPITFLESHPFGYIRSRELVQRVSLNRLQCGSGWPEAEGSLTPLLQTYEPTLCGSTVDERLTRGENLWHYWCRYLNLSLAVLLQRSE